MDEGKSYIVNCKTSKCCICGRRIKNIYSYNGRDYGCNCFMKEVMKTPVDSKEYKQKPVPGWLYELANEYIDKNINYIKEDVQNNCYDHPINGYVNDYEQHINDFEVNFWNSINDLDIKGYLGSVYQNAIKINGKRVPIYQQYIICNYLHMRYKAIYNKIKKGDKQI